MKLTGPAPILAHHEVADFNCGYLPLDEWLRQRALDNEASGASRTYVVTSDAAVVGYYALASGGVRPNEAPGRVLRNMLDPIPVMVLGSLAVDRRWQGKGIGSDMLRDAIIRTLQAAEIVGIRAILVHAIDDLAAKFYERSGFLPSPTQPLTYFLKLSEIEHLLET